MADITLCANDSCPLGMECRRNRFVTKPGYQQSWATFTRRPDGGCDDFLGDAPADPGGTSAMAAAALAVQKAYGGGP